MPGDAGVMAAKDVLGRAGEDRAAAHLIAVGFTVLDRNWRAPGGEIDIVAREGDEVVVVEVKTRTSVAYGHPLEAVSAVKLARLWRLAYAWRRAHAGELRGAALRVDAIAVIGADPATGAIEHLRDLR
ncbi:hypothetical protein RR49_02536 [Microbacterium ginsengisoli]|jgi:putative endonuclease|uniref:UPF0102 protein RR49_02536 n=2 Tax=Microbacterium ginsengisoli TaxID=400772 RepID=A0A0F0LRJ0_9MICO|nr:hypothetical protein RR49_02536 [Microbacterium ginsengisoli]